MARFFLELLARDAGQAAMLSALELTRIHRNAVAPLRIFGLRAEDLAKLCANEFVRRLGFEKKHRMPGNLCRASELAIYFL